MKITNPPFAKRGDCYTLKSENLSLTLEFNLILVEILALTSTLTLCC